MHPNTAFHWQDKAAMAGFAASVGFGMLFLTTPNGPRVAHIMRGADDFTTKAAS